MAEVQGVILDVDGTLVDSNEAHARAWTEALAEQGIEVSVSRVRPLIGMGSDKLLPRVCGIDVDSSKGKQLSKRRQQIFKERYLPHLKPTRGAPELLARMRQQGLKLAVASSANKDDLKDLLAICCGEWLMEQSTSSDDADRSKPDPDIVQVALQQIGLPASQVLMLGDTPYDLEAARRAGIGTIAVRCGGWRDGDFTGAVVVYDDPADLLEHYAGSPLGTHSPSRSG